MVDILKLILFKSKKIKEEESNINILIKVLSKTFNKYINEKYGINIFKEFLKLIKNKFRL